MAIKAIINNTEKEIEQIKNSNEQDIDYVYSRIGDTEVEGAPPISIKSIGGNLSNYRIYGNTVSGESVGDMTANGYKVPVIISGINLFDESVVVDKEVNTAFSNYQVYHQGGILYINGVTTSTQSDVEIANMSGINTEALEYINQNYIKYVFTSISPGAVQIRYSITGSENYFYASNSYTSAPSRNANRLVFRLQKDYQYDHEPIGILIKKEQIQSGYEPYHTPVTTNIYLPEQIKMVGDEAEYVDYAEQKQHRVRKNLLENTATSQTINGVTFTVNNDGTLTLNGQATANTFFTFGSVPINKTIVLTGCPKKGGYSNYLLRAHVRNSTLTYEDTGNGIRFNTNVPTYCEIRIASGYTCDNLTFYPMIRKADITDDTYEPYIENTELDVTLPALSTIKGTNTISVNTSIQPSNIYIKNNFDYKKVFTATRTIEGESPLNYKNIEDNDSTLSNYRIYGGTVNGESVGDRTGNLFDEKFLQGYWAGVDGNFVASTKWICTQKIPCKANTDYTFTFGNKSRWYGFAWYDIDSNYIESNGIAIPTQPTIFTVTSPVDAAFMTVNIAGYPDNSSNITPSDVTDFMLVEGSTALPYEPYGYKVPVTVEGKNLLKNTATSQTINGVTFTVNSDGSVTCNNTATANSILRIGIYLDAGVDYILSGCPIATNEVRIDLRKNSDVVVDKDGRYVVNSAFPITFQLMESGYYDVCIRIASGYICDNLTFYPMIRKTDIEDDAYEPYQSPVTTNIYLPEQIKMVGDEAEYVDYAEQKWHRVRKNLLKATLASAGATTYDGVSISNNDGILTLNGTSNNGSFVNLATAIKLSVGNYILTGGSENLMLRFQKTFSGYGYDDTGADRNLICPEEVTSGVCSLKLTANYTYNSVKVYPMIRKADITDDTYEPYIENTDLDVTLPALPTIKGTNTLTVGTEAQPSDIYLKGKIKKKPKIYYKIYYYSQDGQTLLYTESVLKGSNGMYSGTPTKMADPQYTYTFAGWSSSTGQTTATPEVRNNIQNDKNVYAAFSQTLNTYTVYFYNESDTPIETVQNVPYGGTATYTGATPTKQGYSFTGWSPLPTNITADTSCYAQFKEDEMYESITDTWSEIIANVSNGTYSTKYHIGDTKKIDLGTEGEVIMTIVGIDTDDLADSSGKAPITWISKQLLKTSNRMNLSYISGTEGTGTLGGWEKTRMRSYLKGAVKPLIPETVRNAIKPVKKYSRIYNVSGSAVNDVLTTEDVWIPSYKELFGSGLETLGPTYSTTFPDNTSRIKRTADGSAARWWLRSADTKRTFNNVKMDGSSHSNGADFTCGVALGFCT